MFLNAESLLFCGLIIMVFYVDVQNSNFEEYLNITSKNSCLDIYMSHFIFLMEDFLTSEKLSISLPFPPLHISKGLIII